MERSEAAGMEPDAAEPAEATPAPKTSLTGKRGGFTGILGGDVRLEEALARLSRAGKTAVPAEPVPPQDAPTASRTEAIPLRSSVAEEAEEDEEPEAAPLPLAELPFPSHHQPTPERMPADPFGAFQDGPAFKANGTHSNGHAAPPAYVAPRLHEMEWQGLHENARPAPGFPPAFAPQARLQPDLLSQTASSSTSMAFDRLAEALMNRTTGGDRSLEDVTRDLLRPLLKSWLDENLPGIVERLVREEIERVARRGGAR